MSHNCHIDLIEKVPTNEELTRQETLYLSIDGMGCVNCAARVHNGLLSTMGILDAVIDHTVGLGKVTFNPDLIAPQLVVEAVARSGNDGRHRYQAEILD